MRLPYVESSPTHGHAPVEQLLADDAGSCTVVRAEDPDEALAAVSPSGRKEQRTEPRYLLTRPVLAIPLWQDGSPVASHVAEGFSIDVSTGGFGFEIAGLERIPTKQLVVGVEADNGQMHFATLDVRHVSSVSGRLRVGGQFIPADRCVLRDENLLPTFDTRTCRLVTRLPETTLSRWSDLGVLSPTLVDRVFACPDCQAVPTFRHGCRACGSVRLAECQLIHHFACAYVGMVGEFEGQGGIVCPKCRTWDLVVGADYEYLAGPYRCLDCDWSDTETEFVGQCLYCGLRFPGDKVREIDLIGYHVNRLDPLALLGAT